MDSKQRYIPALGHRALTPFYDGVLRLFLREQVIKRALVAELGLTPGQRVLDHGCGTGTVMLLLGKAEPAAQVIGVDGDADVLHIAERKACRAQKRLPLTQGFAEALPFGDRSFDLVVSSFVFHHLTRSTKQRAMDEVARVLRPDGVFYLLDFGPPANPAAALIAHGVRWFEQTADNLDGLLAPMLEAAGFGQVSVRGSWMTIVGSLLLYRAAPTRP